MRLWSLKSKWLLPAVLVVILALLISQTVHSVIFSHIVRSWLTLNPILYSNTPHLPHSFQVHAVLSYIQHTVTVIDSYTHSEIWPLLTCGSSPLTSWRCVPLITFWSIRLELEAKEVRALLICGHRWNEWTCSSLAFTLNSEITKEVHDNGEGK